MEDLSPQPQEISSATKSEKDDEITYNTNIRTYFGICCICHTPPVHTKNYYSHVFCTDCFYKYIFSAPKTDCSGDIIKKAKDKKEDKKETKEEEQEIKENAAAEEITSK